MPLNIGEDWLHYQRHSNFQIPQISFECKKMYGILISVILYFAFRWTLLYSLYRISSIALLEYFHLHFLFVSLEYGKIDKTHLEVM